jgi:Na+-driven multidrug efflux pump
VLFFARYGIVDVFGATGEDAALVLFFCEFLAISYIFTGGLFVANAAFNNLGYPLLSTLFNWGKATLGTIPFVWAGARLAGAEGVLAGFAIGAVPFGIVALIVCRRIIDRLSERSGRPTSSWWSALSGAHRQSPAASRQEAG